MVQKLVELPFDAKSVAALGVSIDELKACLTDGGEVILPGDAAYDTQRRPWNLDFAGTPSAIVRVGSEKEVATVVKLASENNLNLCVVCGRHSMYSSISNSLMLDLGRLNKCTVDAAAKTALVEGGALLGALDKACEPHGLAVTAGHNPTTGVGGLTLGGGFGLLSRAFGMTIDMIISMRVVLASGEVVEVSKESDPDLFWALRGGQGNFGIVTQFKFRLLPVGTNGKVVAGPLVYPPVPLGFLFKAPVKAFKAHRDYWKTMPNEQGGMAVLLGKGPFLAIYCHAGSLEAGKAEAKKVSKVAKTVINQLKPMSYHLGAQRLALGPDGKGQGQGFYYERGLLVDQVPDEMIDVLWQASRKAPTKDCAALIVHLGGKAAEIPDSDAAFGHRSAKFWVIVLGNWVKLSDRDACVKWTKETHEKIVRWRVGNYNAIGEDDGFSIFGQNLAKLKEVKAKYDPKNLFKNNRNIVP